MTLFAMMDSQGWAAENVPEKVPALMAASVVRREVAQYSDRIARSAAAMMPQCWGYSASRERMNSSYDAKVACLEKPSISMATATPRKQRRHCVKFAGPGIHWWAHEFGPVGAHPKHFMLRCWARPKGCQTVKQVNGGGPI